MIKKFQNKIKSHNFPPFDIIKKNGGKSWNRQNKSKEQTLKTTNQEKWTII